MATPSMATRERVGVDVAADELVDVVAVREGRIVRHFDRERKRLGGVGYRRRAGADAGVDRCLDHVVDCGPRREFERIALDTDEAVPQLDHSIGLEREALADEFQARSRRRHLGRSSGRGVDVAGEHQHGERDDHRCEPTT